MSWCEGWRLTIHTLCGGDFVADMTSFLAEWDMLTEINESAVFTGRIQTSPECCDTLARIEPWWTEWRLTGPDGCVVGEGPIVVGPKATDSDGSGLLVGGGMIDWLKVRVVHNNHTSIGAPISAAAWVAELITDALAPSDPCLLPHVVVCPGTELVEREITGNTSYAWDAITDMLGTLVDVSVHGRRIYIGPPGGCCVGDLGTIGTRSFTGAWRLDADGQSFATKAVVNGATGVTATSGGVVTSGSMSLLVERLTSDDQITTNAQAQAQADATVSPGSLAPIVFVIDGDSGTLDCATGIDPCTIVVGACATLQASGCGETISSRVKVRAVRFASDGSGCVSVGVRLGAVDE